MLELDRVRILKRSRIRVLLLALQATLHTLQSEGHDVDDIIQILCNHMKNLGMNLLVLEGLREMSGKQVEITGERHEQDSRQIVRSMQ